MTYKPRHRPQAAKKCWCGSGLKAKNCHGTSEPRLAKAVPLATFQQQQRKQEPLSSQQKKAAAPILGVPGEEQKIWVVPIMEGQPIELIPGSFDKPGKYKVQFLLSRPGYPVSKEWEHKFIDDVVGDSHFVIAKPAKERNSAADIDQLLLQANHKNNSLLFIGIANDDGHLGKLVIEELEAQSGQDAENIAYEALAPSLSAWSLHLDIPIHVETIQVTELQHHVSSMRVRNPNLDMAFGGGLGPILSDEFCHYASLYREGLNANSGFYRFLCFYKIIESLVSRRGRIDHARKVAGEAIRRTHERVPTDMNELVALLKGIYPWRANWDAMAIEQMLPQEARGKKVTYVQDHYFNPLRVGIAHALLKTGEVRITLDKIEHIQQANKWLPLCRIMARVMLKNEFPEEFAFKMKTVDTVPEAMQQHAIREREKNTQF